jgi:molybdopterin synthase sulfur carrier subunit
MAHVRLFAAAREAAGTSQTNLDGETVGDVIDAAIMRFGTAFELLLPSCNFWLNGEPAIRTDSVTDTDEVAVLPPVSGGAL